jgi:hypothetical protein
VRKALVIGGMAGLLVLTACGGKDDSSSGPAASKTTAAAASDPLTLGPDGFRKLKLGATEADVKAAGWKIVGDLPGTPACPKTGELVLPNMTVTVSISTKYGAAAITALADMHTPEGIKEGSSLADTKKAYPQLTNPTGLPDSGRFETAVPGNANAKYRITVSQAKVVGVELIIGSNDCDPV